MLKAINEINPSKSECPDAIHPRVVYECENAVVGEQFKMLRKCLDESRLPIEWKEAIVTLINKSGKNKCGKLSSN